MRISRFALVPVLLIAGLSAPAPAEDDMLGPMAEQLRNRVGIRCVAARLRFAPDARPVDVVAIAEGRLLGGRWLVTELDTMEGRGFHGLGVNGWDAANQAYVGYWVDSTRGLAIPVEGRFDPASGAFITRSVERGAGGDVIVVSETRADGPDAEVTTFTATDAQGRSFERMVLRYVRAPAGGRCDGVTATRE